MNDQRPEIADMDQEKQILMDRLIENISGPLRHMLKPGLTVGEDAEVIVGSVIVGALHHLRVMSARQMAVLLAAEANRHEGWTIHEPPHYTKEEIEGVE